MKTLVTTLAVALSPLCFAGTAQAEELLREIRWDELAGAGKLSVGELIDSGHPEGFRALRVENRQNNAAVLTLLTLENPGITEPQYALSGEIRYENVDGKAYLEMWNHFDDGQYFTRTLADFGPMQSLEGTADWRPVSLPFFINSDSGKRPNRLVLNLVLPGKGTVDLGPLRLVQFASGEDPFAVAGQWWGNRTGGWIGGIFGSIIGCLGGLIGWLSSKGRARRLVLGTLAGMIGLGILVLGAGFFALARSQPYAVYYPLLLSGFLCSVIPAALYATIRKRYEAAELRRMSALDAPGRAES